MRSLSQKSDSIMTLKEPPAKWLKSGGRLPDARSVRNFQRLSGNARGEPIADAAAQKDAPDPDLRRFLHSRIITSLLHKTRLPNCKQIRTQNALFPEGLTWWIKRKVFETGKGLWIDNLGTVFDTLGLLASPTGFEPVLPP